jgi:hypothetical protein
MGKYGTDLTGLGAYEGGVNNDKGSPLVANNTDGATALLFGPAALREIQAGVANGDFAIPPDQASSAITEENPLPYFTTQDFGNGRITATIADATLAAGQQVLRFTMTNAVNNDYFFIDRFVSIPTSEARSFGNQPRFAVSAATSSANYRLYIASQYYEADLTTTASALREGVVTGSTIATSLAALSNAGVEYQSNTNGTGNAPADAAFLWIRVGVQVTGNVTAATLDLSEIRIDRSQIQYLVTDQSLPDLYGPASLYLFSGNLFLSNGGIVGSEPKLILGAASGDISLDATTQGKTITLTSASRTGSTVTIVTTSAHAFANGYEVVVAGITGTAGTTMNGTFIVTVTNSTTFTYTAAGTAGSGTVTGATVKAGPGSGIIYLKPAATAAGRVQVDGDMALDGFLYFAGDKSGAYIRKSGTNARTIAALSATATDGVDWVASTSSTRSGIMVTKSVTGQPTTNLNGTGATDAFADVLRNGGIALDVSNNRGYFYSSGWKYAALTTPSDSRLKDEITDITGALDKLRQLVPVAFKWKRPEAHGRTEAVDDDGVRMGFIADQVATTDLKHWVETLGVDEREADLVDTTEVLAVNIPQNEMEALVVQALLDIDARLKALESR